MSLLKFREFYKDGKIAEEVERAKEIADRKYFDKMYDPERDAYAIELEDFIYTRYGEGEGENFRVNWGFNESLERYLLDWVENPEETGQYIMEILVEDEDIDLVWQDLIAKRPEVNVDKGKYFFLFLVFDHFYEKPVESRVNNDCYWEEEFIEILFDIDKKYGLDFREFPHDALRDLLKLYGNLPLKYLNRSFELYRRINIGIMEDMKYTNGDIESEEEYGPYRFDLEYLEAAKKDVDWFVDQLENYLKNTSKENSEILLKNLKSLKLEKKRLKKVIIEVEKKIEK